MRKAVVFHSVSGWTRKTGNFIAKALHADVFHIDEIPENIENYDLVVIGTPVYACGPSNRVMEFLKKHRFRNLSFFCTYAMFGGVTCLFALKNKAQCDRYIDGIDLRYTPIEKLKKNRSSLEHKKQRILAYVNYLKKEIGEHKEAV